MPIADNNSNEQKMKKFILNITFVIIKNTQNSTQAEAIQRSY